ncbi:MAG: hypothetical protein Q9187_001992 [Circinaria calcarea]
MQIAQILSDLTSLRVCDHDAAIALVSSHKAPPKTPASSQSDSTPAQSSRKQSDTSSLWISKPTFTRRTSAIEGAEEDPDLQRAIDLVELHFGLKEKHLQGVDMGLRQARVEVDRVLQRLKAGERVGSQGRGGLG